MGVHKDMKKYIKRTLMIIPVRVQMIKQLKNKEHKDSKNNSAIGTNFEKDKKHSDFQPTK